MNLRPSGMKFKFGNAKSTSICITKFRFPRPDGGSLDMDIDVIDLDVPLLLGLRELISHRLLVDYLNNSINTQRFNWKTRLTDKHGHLYWELGSAEAFYSQA